MATRIGVTLHTVEGRNVTPMRRAETERGRRDIPDAGDQRIDQSPARDYEEVRRRGIVPKT
ncbi:MAG: hypothetical protein ACRDKL_01050 [Solirubrobacteraceae bacterium]